MKTNISTSNSIKSSVFVISQPTVVDVSVKFKIPFFLKIKEYVSNVIKFESFLKENVVKYAKKNDIVSNKNSKFSVMISPKIDVNDGVSVIDNFNIESIPAIKSPWDSKIICNIDKMLLTEE